MLSTAELCSHLIYLLHAPIRWYSSQRVPQMHYQNFDQQQDPVAHDPFFENLLLDKANEEFPVLHFEFNSVIYGIIKSADEGFFILGPCSLALDTRVTAQKISKSHHISKDYRISACRLENFVEICAILFHHCSGISLTWSEIISLNASDELLDLNIEKEMNDVIFSYQEQGKVHNPYEQERREQSSIRNGDLEGLKNSFKETYSGEVGTLGKTTLRHSQNIAITLIALASRSAIEGGLAAETAYSISDSYVLQIEEILQPADAIALARQAEIYYTKLVAEHKQDLEKNSLVARCKNYVKQHICEKIRVSDLADALGVTSNYLSEKFSKEEGLSLIAYINQEKIEFSKQRLRYSNDSYGTISYTLGFSSQSHFTSVFRKVAGCTPKQYRDKYR